jgi:putative membrane protein
MGGFMRIPYLVLVVTLSVPMVMAGQNSSAAKINTQQQQLTTSDKLFLEALIEEDISEIELAHMALQKSSDPQVKDYAQSKILAADPEMRDGAEQIAKQFGMQPSNALNARQKKIHDVLSKKTGKEFDNAYMNYEAGQQTGDVKLVDAELKSDSNPAVKAYVTKEKAPVVEAAKAAKEISTQISTSMEHYSQKATETGGPQQHR